jgi:gamma-glutamyltranspeptidase/glutathione hydrolase
MPLPQQQLLMRVMVQSITVIGFFLNNEMDDFSAKAGVPICLDSLEMKQTALPHKKDAEFHDTTIVEKNGKLL